MRYSTTQRVGCSPLFSFVVVADTHVNERDAMSTSPFQTNHIANQRARYVFEEIAAMEDTPAFVVHLGDIVHPVPSLPTFDDAVDCFKAIAAPLSVPLHVIPGNHDVGDKRVNWMPADQVCDDYLRIYRDKFGPDYYAFDQGPVRFVMLNSLLLNSGLSDEAEQRAWFESELHANVDRRIFVFMHYPPYIYQPDERGNYDNVDEPARSWLVECLKQPGVEAVFAGHVHNYWYDRLGGAEFYMLPSTAFLRHDFAEFYSIAPDVEYGRGDVERFGYFVVQVFDDHHIAYSIRSQGERCAQGETIDQHRHLWLAHPRSANLPRTGVELRHPWAQSMQITSTGGVQEFGRKWARNDYPLLALTEMGVQLAKVPDIDVLEDESRERMGMLARTGVEFIVTTLGLPKPSLTAHRFDDLGIKTLEFNTTAKDFEGDLDAIKLLRASSGASFSFAKILANDDSRFDGQHFTHFVKSGFTVAELDTFASLIRKGVSSGAIDCFSVRHDVSEDLVAAATTVEQFAVATQCRAIISIKLAGPSVATARNQDRQTTKSVIEAMVLSRVMTNITFVFDTFMDVDRGYYPRNGLIDRRYNPRQPARAFSMLNVLLSTVAEIKLIDTQPGVITLLVDSSPAWLLTGETQSDDWVNDVTAAHRVFDLVNECERDSVDLRTDAGFALIL